jgi:protein TonB
MNAIFHAINIGTLATWLSVTGFGTVAGLIPVWHPETRKPTLLDALPVSQDFILGEEESSDDLPSDSPLVTNDSPVTNLPAPPELPALAESEPLPEIPDLPAPKAVESPAPAPVAAKPAPRPAVTGKPGSTARSSADSSSPGASAGSVKTSGSGTGSGMSNAARLAAGRMNSPSYPSYSRRNNQTGTVLVEFTVDAAGRVISAYAKSSSNWPLLDNEAVRTVRSWKFPPGGVMKLQRPIVFRLN